VAPVLLGQGAVGMVEVHILVAAVVLGPVGAGDGEAASDAELVETFGHL